MIFDITQLLATVLGLLIPIVAIVGAYLMNIKKKQAEVEVRRLIIENATDKGTAELLLKEMQKPADNGEKMYNTLRTGALLVGAGLGTMLFFVLENYGVFEKSNHMAMVMLLAGGAGLGLLLGFAVEWKLRKPKVEAEDQLPTENSESTFAQ